MDIKEYFDEVQEYVKQNIQNPEEIDSIIKELEKDNLQAVVNQDFNNNVSIEECAEKIIKTASVQGGIDMNEPDKLDGERGLNTMERRIYNFNEFVNEGQYRDDVKYLLGVLNGKYKNMIEHIMPYKTKTDKKLEIMFNSLPELNMPESMKKQLENLEKKWDQSSENLDWSGNGIHIIKVAKMILQNKSIGLDKIVDIEFNR